MSKKKRNTKIVTSFMQAIHQLLCTDFHCTEEEIMLIDRALEGQVPTEIADHMTNLFSGNVPLPEPRKFYIDFEDGNEPRGYQLSNHPEILLLDYLQEKYRKPFCDIYWGALTPSNSPKEFIKFLRIISKVSSRWYAEESEVAE